MSIGSVIFGLGAPAVSMLSLDTPPALVRAPKYPAIALRNEISGPVRVRLVVKPNGKVMDCAIVVSSGYYGLDLGTCATLKKDAMFAPLVKRADRQFEIGINWSVAGRGSIPDALRILGTRLSDLREGQQVPPAIVLGSCQQQTGFRGCDVGPPPVYLRTDIPSAGKLRLAINIGAAVTGFDLEFDGSMTVAAAADITHYHGPPCFEAKDRATQGWVAGGSYLVLTKGRVIAGKREMSPLLEAATTTCPSVLPL